MGNILIENGKAVGGFGSPIPANQVSYNGSNVETALNELNADITVSTSSVSFSSPWQRWTTNNLSKFNGVVIANVSFYPSSAVTAGVETQIGTMPSGYRPAYTVRTRTSDGCGLAITTSGAILYTPQHTTPYASFSVVYTV